MRRGNVAIQTGQALRTQCSGGGGQHNMCCQSAKIRIVALRVSCGLCHHNPEGILSTVFYKVLVEAVTVQLQRLTEDCTDDACRLRILQTTDGCHNSQMQPRSCGDVLCHCSHAFSALDAVEELTVAFHHTAHRGIVRQAHFVHPDGVEVCTEFFAVKFDVDQPVILRLLIPQRRIHQVVAGRIVRSKNLLG